MVRPYGRGVDFTQPYFPLSLLPPLDTMAQQSVTRVTGRRSGCHHKTFQLVIANINVAAPAHARCRADSHARHAVLTRPSGTRARVPGTRTLLFPLSAGWKTTTAGVGGAQGGRGGGRVNGGGRWSVLLCESLWFKVSFYYPFCRLNLFSLGWERKCQTSDSRCADKANNPPRLTSDIFQVGIFHAARKRIARGVTITDMRRYHVGSVSETFRARSRTSRFQERPCGEVLFLFNPICNVNGDGETELAAISIDQRREPGVVTSNT